MAQQPGQAGFAYEVESFGPGDDGAVPLLYIDDSENDRFLGQKGNFYHQYEQVQTAEG